MTPWTLPAHCRAAAVSPLDLMVGCQLLLLERQVSAGLSVSNPGRDINSVWFPLSACGIHAVIMLEACKWNPCWKEASAVAVCVPHIHENKLSSALWTVPEHTHPSPHINCCRLEETTNILMPACVGKSSVTLTYYPEEINLKEEDSECTFRCIGPRPPDSAVPEPVWCILWGACSRAKWPSSR